MKKAGDLFLTRSLNPIANFWPGYWNHTAMWSGSSVLESLMPRGDFKGGMVELSFEEWLKKQEDWVLYRCTEEEAAKKAVKHAYTLFGKKWGIFSSWVHLFGFRTKMEHMNCVSAMRLCYQKGFEKDPMWRIADDIMNDSRFYHVPLV